MNTSAATADERLLLGELARLGVGLAQRLHDAAQTTDDLEALARLGAAFHQVSRGVRQSLALKARFAAGWVPAARAPQAAVAPEIARGAPQAAPADATRPEATGWTEYERLDSDELIDELDRLAELPEDEPIDVARFEAALEAGVARLRRGLLALRPHPAPRNQPAARARSGPRLTPAPRPGSRAGLMNGAAALRLADSS
jgi:hypothetical protein